MTVNRDGQTVVRARIQSGGTTADERALGFLKSSLATRTEARAVRNIPLKAGDEMTINGQYTPLPCMQRRYEQGCSRYRRNDYLHLARWNLDRRRWPVRVGYVRDEESNFEAVVFLDDATGRSLEIQRSLVSDDQDRRLGMDTYAITANGVTHYGGVLSWGAEGGRLRLELSPEASEVLGIDSHVALDMDPRDLATVSAPLTDILG